MRSNENPDRQGNRKTISKKIRFEVFKRDKFTCRYCGTKAPDAVLHVDHVQPVCKGGEGDLSNLVTACFGCNMGKGGVCLDILSPTLPPLFRPDKVSIRIARREALNAALMKYEYRGRKLIRSLVGFAHERRVDPALVKSIAETSKSYSEFQAELYRIALSAEAS